MTKSIWMFLNPWLNMKIHWIVLKIVVFNCYFITNKTSKSIFLLLLSLKKNLYFAPSHSKRHLLYNMYDVIEKPFKNVNKIIFSCGALFKKNSYQDVGEKVNICSAPQLFLRAVDPHSFFADPDPAVFF